MSSLHPAESAEFLSRLVDGELSAPEAKQFEAHRASCAACRDAAEEFDRSLRAFRASPTAAPASDLSARILRKIREQSPSRRPFGVMFGIDIRWAGIVATALLIVIIAPALFRREQAPLAPAGPAEPDALPAYLLEEKTSEPKQAAPKSAPPARPAPSKDLTGADKEMFQSDSANTADGAKKIEESQNKSEVARELSDAAPPSAAEREKSFAARPNAPAAVAAQEAPAPTSRRQRQTAAAPGGESGAAAGAVEGDRTEVRLVIQAIDGHGEAPELEGTPTDEALAGLSGREFILLVETGGRVRDVTPSAANGSRLRKDELKAKEGALSQKAEGWELLALRFAPSDRPRRLLVKVQ